jgi:hypothetical protein
MDKAGRIEGQEAISKLKGAAEQGFRAATDGARVSNAVNPLVSRAFTRQF